MKSASCAVANTSTKPPACGQPTFAGTGIAWDSCTVHELRLPPAPEQRHDAVSRPEPLAAQHDLAGALEPGDVDGRARRRRVETGALDEVCAVDAGGANADEDLAVPRDGVGTLLERQAPFTDDDRAHSVMLRP